MNSESFALEDEEIEEDEKEDIGDPYDYLQSLLENCLQKRTFDRATGDPSLRKKLTNEHRNEFKEVIKVCSDRFFHLFFLTEHQEVLMTIMRGSELSLRRLVNYV